jgi:hypothetical protein
MEPDVMSSAAFEDAGIRFNDRKKPRGRGETQGTTMTDDRERKAASLIGS